MPVPALTYVLTNPPAQWWQILTACLTPVIAVAVALITLNQYRVAKAKLKLDLFDRRYAVFRKVWETLSVIAIKGATSQADGFYTPFNNILPDTEFLFGKEMHKYVSHLASQWSRLKALEQDENRPSNRPEVIQNLRSWFEAEAKSGVKAKFSDYLDFERWR